MKLSLLRDLPKENLKNKRILFRVDFEVPIKNGLVQDGYRIKAVFPTLNYLLSFGAKILFLTKRGHLEIDHSPELSTKELIPYLEEHLAKKVVFISDFPELNKFSDIGNEEQLFMFENLRFWPGEEANDENFAKKFAKAADLYVNDNFGTAHRPHASIIILPRLLPSYAGFLLEQEIKSLQKITENAEKPVMAILGGVKLETKLPLVKKFLQAGDTVLVGGGIANSIFSAKGYNFGKDCQEKNGEEYLQELNLEDKNLYLPVDGFVAESREKKERLIKIKDIAPDECIFDIGPETIKFFEEKLKSAKTIFWNGPMGMAEDKRFATGTISLAKKLEEIKAFKLLGGGDSISILERENLLKVFNHVSTGGGSMLAFLAGQQLPGIEALKKS